MKLSLAPFFAFIFLFAQSPVAHAQSCENFSGSWVGECEDWSRIGLFDSELRIKQSSCSEKSKKLSITQKIMSPDRASNAVQISEVDLPFGVASNRQPASKGSVSNRSEMIFPHFVKKPTEGLALKIRKYAIATSARNAAGEQPSGSEELYEFTFEAANKLKGTLAKREHKSDGSVTEWNYTCKYFKRTR